LKMEAKPYKLNVNLKMEGVFTFEVKEDAIFQTLFQRGVRMFQNLGLRVWGVGSTVEQKRNTHRGTSLIRNSNPP